MFRGFLRNTESSHELCAEGWFPRMAWEKERSAPTENQNTRIQLKLHVEICNVQRFIFCVKKLPIKGLERFASDSFYFQLSQNVNDLQRGTSIIWILPCSFASEVTASKLQAFFLHVQKWSVMCYPSNLGCTTTTRVPRPAVQWPEQHLPKEDQFFLKMFYVKHPEMQAPKGHLWPKNLLSAEKRRKLFPVWGWARGYESLAAVKSSLFKMCVQTKKANSFHAVTNH